MPPAHLPEQRLHAARVERDAEGGLALAHKRGTGGGALAHLHVRVEAVALGGVVARRRQRLRRARVYADERIALLGLHGGRHLPDGEREGGVFEGRVHLVEREGRQQAAVVGQRRVGEDLAGERLERLARV